MGCRFIGLLLEVQKVAFEGSDGFVKVTNGTPIMVKLTNRSTCFCKCIQDWNI